MQDKERAASTDMPTALEAKDSTREVASAMTVQHDQEPDEFQPVSVESRTAGEQRVFRFDNGYGASVVRSSYSYGGGAGLWELAVIKYDGDEWKLTYETPVTNDVLGWQSDDDVQATLRRIRDLPAAQS